MTIAQHAGQRFAQRCPATSHASGAPDAATRRSLVIPIIALAIFIGAAIIIWRLLAASITLGPMGAPPPGAGWW